MPIRLISWAFTIPCWLASSLLRTMSVSVVPGASAFTRIPAAANSEAIARVIVTIAALAEQYIDT